jgi:Arc/MetJ family transcription regulator
MRLTITIDPDLLADAQRLSGAKTKREAIELALREMTSRHRREQIAAHGGTVDLAFSVDDLLNLRAQG